MACMFTLILTNKCVNQRSMTVILGAVDFYNTSLW